MLKHEASTNQTLPSLTFKLIVFPCSSREAHIEPIITLLFNVHIYGT